MARLMMAVLSQPNQPCVWVVDKVVGWKAANVPKDIGYSLDLGFTMDKLKVSR